MTVPDAGHCPSCGRTFAKSSGHCPSDGTRIVALAPAAQDGMLGRVLDQRYEVREAMAQGKIGAMYRGWQISVAREVAIKIIHPTFAGDRAAAERFCDAARLACQLVAPSIANTYDFGRTDDGVVYVVSELLRGRTLEHETKQRTVTARRVVGLAIQMCDALDAAHRASAVHGDLKPANVMVDDSSGRDVVKVLDFGLARALLPERAPPDPRRGLPLYTAPEQLAGAAVDVRCDLYALGCILHELLTGAPPFTGATLEAIASKHRGEPPPALPPNVPGDLAVIVKQLLAKTPGERFATCKNLRARLVALQSVVGTPATGTPRVSGSISAQVPNAPYISRDPTTPPTTPPSWMPGDRTTPPSMPPYQRTTPPSVPPSVPPSLPSLPSLPPVPRDPTIPPLPSGHQQALQQVALPAAEPSGGRRVLVIAVVAIVVSAGGIAAYVLATG